MQPDGSEAFEHLFAEDEVVKVVAPADGVLAAAAANRDGLSGRSALTSVNLVVSTSDCSDKVGQSQRQARTFLSLSHIVIVPSSCVLSIIVDQLGSDTPRKLRPREHTCYPQMSELSEILTNNEGLAVNKASKPCQQLVK